MPRIVAGWAGSLQLAVPPDGTRPTSDRTREALFSVLEARGAVGDAAVLDLYSGSGALGLEALSRGAASAVLVERAPRAARVIRENAVRLRKASASPVDLRVVQQAVRPFLVAPGGPFDLVLSDPPYDLADADVDADLAALVPHLAEEALVVVERSVRSPAPTPPEGLVLDRTRTWGDTAVHLLIRT